MSLEEISHPSQQRTWAEVDLGAVRHNIRAFKELVGPDVMLMPPVKANAYGHGAVRVAKAAVEAGASRLGVATCAEGEELRAAGIAVPIQIIGACLPEEVERAVEAGLTLSVHEMYVARLASLAAVRLDRVVPLHLKIDTGMGRLGILPENAVASALEIADLPNIELEGVFMHFAEANDEIYSRVQIDELKRALDLLAQAGIVPAIVHAASTVAAVLYPEARFDCIRPGLGVYGIYDPSWLRQRIRLKPVMSWKALVVQIKDYPPGNSLGYNRTYVTRKPTRVAVLPVGYADGYLRGFSNTAHVIINGVRAPVVGMVSMDYTMVDVTGIKDVDVGTVATLIGSDGAETVTAEELAALVPDIIPYEITTRLGPRVARCYLNG